VFNTIIQFIVGGILLILLVWKKLNEFLDVFFSIFPWPPRIRVVLRSVVRAAVGLVAIACLVDPLIPGTACVTIYAPKRLATPIDSLEVRVVPVGFSGPAGGNRTIYSGFDARGVAEIVADMGMFETRIKVEVFDQSRPSHVVAMTGAYVSPFVRRQITNTVVKF
jgi:hypothetical protein